MFIVYKSDNWVVAAGAGSGIGIARSRRLSDGSGSGIVCLDGNTRYCSSLANTTFALSHSILLGGCGCSTDG